tara:strand:- start:7024 stop:7317 length:294 start_codon:yes stop_codon:yes gene_type:complete
LQKDDILKSDLWQELVDINMPALFKPEGSELLLMRLTGQYLPVIIQAKNESSVEKARMALWHYLVSPINKNKPFTMEDFEADKFIQDTMVVLGKLGY